MSSDLGDGVTRTLSAEDRQYQLVVWQAGQPPLDSELNLVMSSSGERLRGVLKAQMPSGWIIDPLSSGMQEFLTSPAWSNWFRFGNPATGVLSPVEWAAVNGWVIPVSGSNEDSALNRINLYPPPATDGRSDLVFLEVWEALVSANPSQVNKPSASRIWKYGNVQYGGENLIDDIADPAVNFETTKRIQLQYRLRVYGSGVGLGAAVDLTTYTEGLGDPNVLGQGASTSPQSGFRFFNMGTELGDAGLWRAGDGDPQNSLGTVDGYVYAIPLCAVRRRNSSPFNARSPGGNANQNGALDRNPISVAITDPVEATRTFGAVTLNAALTPTAVGVVQVVGLAGSGLDNTNIDWDSTFLMLGDEVIYISGVNTAVSPGTITIRTGGRGRNGTAATRHEAGTPLEFFAHHPEGLTADMVTTRDIHDLRHAVSIGGWDHAAILARNLDALFQGKLATSIKQPYSGDVYGTHVLEVDTLFAVGSTAVPNQTEALDGPDGIRTVFSDAVVTQPVSLLLAPFTGSAGTPVAVADYEASAGSWTYSGFDPSGFQPDGGGWSNQSIIEVNIGGATLNSGARATVRNTANNRIVRFVTPREWWLNRAEAMGEVPGSLGAQCPVQFRVLTEAWGESQAADEPAENFPGPMFPTPESNFERPFIFLGGLAAPTLKSSSAATLAAGSVPSAYSQVRIAGLDFDEPGTWFATEASSLVTGGVANLLLHGSRNLYDLLTDGGRDESGGSSGLYLVLSGDTVNSANAGVFRVIGAGTVGYTAESGATAADLVVRRVGEGSSTLVAATGLNAELRTQFTHALDGSTLNEGASALIVLTDLLTAEQGAAAPWNGLVSSLPLEGQAVLNTTLVYAPSRGGTARVANEILRVAMAGVDSATLLREAPTTLDATIDGLAGVPSGEVYLPVSPVQTWNRLPAQGLHGVKAPAHGDMTTRDGEVRRDAEVFIDEGSKTLVIRPFQRTDLTLVRYQATGGSTNRLIPETYTAGDWAGENVDGGALFPAGCDYAYAVPWEAMPQLGRQDIPVHQTTGVGQQVFPGVNHLFGDSTVNADDVFRIIGGVDSQSTVNSIFFQTGATSGRSYGEFFSMGLSSAGYQARIVNDASVYSSDLGVGLKGIQLPPFLGVARLYGVYDLREFAGQGSWNADRVTKSLASGRPKNLLRLDADKQTLFILRGGASDVTGSEDDHTYVIPENVIDPTLSGQYESGDSFDTMEFVVEAVVFGFSSGFITKNNWVLARNHLPTGVLGSAADAVATQVSAILPLPLPYGEQVYVAYTRIPYQGDPYMTRYGASKVVNDYAARLGQITPSNAVHLKTPISQFDSAGTPVPQATNARSLEVLAALDFQTTLGTGRIGGEVWPGTLTDVGHLEGVSRLPAASSSPALSTQVRSFTEGPGQDDPRASLKLVVLQSASVSDGEQITIRRGAVAVSLMSNTHFTGGSISSTVDSLVAAINASVVAKFGCRVVAQASSDEIEIFSMTPGAESETTTVSLTPKSGSRFVAGVRFRQEDGKYSPNRTSMRLSVREAMPVRNGLPQIGKPGLSERLPLGILAQDSDFLGEDPSRSGASGMRVSKCLPGLSVMGLADGSLLRYVPWTESTTSGARSFRSYRGGSAYTLDQGIEGTPLTWAAEGYAPGCDPVVKGSVIVGRAYLVRNAAETAFGSNVRSYGGELQMVIVTKVVVGDSAQWQVELSPTGHGEGYTAADRYRLIGKPLQGKLEKLPNPAVPIKPSFGSPS